MFLTVRQIPATKVSGFITKIPTRLELVRKGWIYVSRVGGNPVFGVRRLP